jgi:protein archease
MREGMSWRFADDLSVSDTGFIAEGTSLLELLRSAVDATLAVMIGDPDTLREQRVVPVRLEADEPAGLVFQLLQEVIFLKDKDRLLVRLTDGALAQRGEALVLEGVLAGEPLDELRHEAGTDVKAVTLHRFEVVEQGGRWRAQVVLDV